MIGKPKHIKQFDTQKKQQYLCNLCGAAVTELIAEADPGSVDGWWFIDTYAFCPICLYHRAKKIEKFCKDRNL